MTPSRPALDPDLLRDWIGRTETHDDVVTVAPLNALSATLDRDDAPFAAGQPVPPCWHWLYFLPMPRQRDLGPDGHARRGGFLPPVPLPRRMWAGSQFRFEAPIRVGQSIRRVSRIEDVRAKDGRTGPLVFVRVLHRVSADGVHALDEWHDLVYRDLPDAGAAEAPAGVPAPADAAWSHRVEPDDVLLFRYSALTFNGHRIHYDRRYVTQVEGYPGLVVHGPLLATLLLERLRRELPHAVVREFSFRAMRPTFDTAPFDVCGRPAPDGRSVALWIRSHDGFVAMQATATLDGDGGGRDGGTGSDGAPSGTTGTLSQERAR